RTKTECKTENTMWFSSSLTQSSPLSLYKPNLHSSQSLTLPTKTPTARNAAGCSSTTPFILPSHVNSITSTSNPFVKHCVKLRNSSSYRHSHGSVLLVGSTPIREMYSFQESKDEKASRIDCLLLHENSQVPEDFVESGIRIVRVSSLVMKKLCGVQSTESIDAVSLVKIPSTFLNLEDDHCLDSSKWFPSAFRILVLDGIQDPGNLGTLLRSAVAFGWDGAFLLPGCCDPFNDKALRASRGASFQLPMVSGRWSHLQSLVDGLKMKILAGDPGSKDRPVSCLTYELAHSLIDMKLCLVLGSEGGGISEEAREVAELSSQALLGDLL
ncbi:hypothetical protein M8C21_028906, partial [Ambrosia artemisiifolia]